MKEHPMLNFSPLFFTTDDNEPDLHSNLDLSDKERETIQAAKNDVRNALRDQLPRVYKEAGHEDAPPTPRFFTQGSYAYKTLNAPAKEPQQADIDDGCYLPMSFMIQTKRPRVAANVFFELAEKALETLCEERGWLLTGKPTCIRVQISQRAHIDVPLYAIPDHEFEKLAKAFESRHGYTLDSVQNSIDRWDVLPQDKVLLADREKGWMHSDPRTIKDWFVDQVDKKGEQLRRVVRYLKAFRDWRWASGGPSSILLMAAAAPVFQKLDRRDDAALLQVVQRIPAELRKGVNNPRNPDESLTDRLRKTDPTRDVVEDVASEFERFGRELQAILEASKADQACVWMRNLFGGRFPDHPHRVKVTPSAVAPSAVAAAIAASSPAQAAPSEIMGRTRAG